MSGKHSRDKGARFERQVAADLNAVFPICDARRNLGQYQQSDGRDITFAGEDLPICVQCKCGKRINIPKAMEEARSSCSSVEEPVVAAHWDNGETVAVLPWKGFLHILKHAMENQIP